MAIGVGLGGLAQGLAEGMNMGMQWRNQKRSLDLQERYQGRLEKADERDAEVHGARMDQYNAEKAIRDRRQAAMQEIADSLGGGGAQTAPTAPGVQSIQNPNAPSFNAPVPQQSPSMQAAPPPAGSLGAVAPAPFAANNQAGSLAPQQPQQQPQQPQMEPSKIIAKTMLTGAYTPEGLTQMANIFAKHGLHEEGTAYLEKAYVARNRGITQAGMALMQNNPGSAMEVLKAHGTDVKEMPVKVKPNDPNDHNWEINIEGQGKKTINVSDWLQSTVEPEAFFKIQDQKRKTDLESIKTNNDTRKTDAEIGYLKSRSRLAEAGASKADRYEPGGLKPSRSSEAQINSALTRRDKAFDRVTSEKNEEGKFEVNPQKRQELDSASNQYQEFLENQLGEELDARQHHKFTDVMATYPIGGTPAQIKQWQKTQFLPRFGAQVAKEEAKQETPSRQAPLASQQQASPPAKPSGPAPGSLASMKAKDQAQQTVKAEMAAVQQALQAPNLTAEQKKALALKAQEIAVRRDALK